MHPFQLPFFLRLVRRKFPVVLTLVAWLLATGSHWDVIQTMAWTRMLVHNTRTLPLLKAVQRTFRPEGRCSVCKAVAAAKQQEQSNGVPERKFDGKILLAFEPTPTVVIEEPRFVPFVSRAECAFSADRAAPPRRPPRV